jgi:predicted ATPase
MSDPLPDIPTARAWWARHGHRVAEALPLTVGAHTYLPAYASLLPARLAAAEEWPLHLAECEVLRGLRALRAQILRQDCD